MYYFKYINLSSVERKKPLSWLKEVIRGSPKGLLRNSDTIGN